MIEFPDTLPCWSAENYSYSSLNAILSSEFGNGLEVDKRKRKAPPLYISAGIMLSSSELEIFEAWRFDTLSYINWFTATVKTAQGLVTKKLKFTNTDEQKQYLGGDYWRLEFVLESPKHDYLSEDATELIVAFGMPLGELPAFFNEFENIANADFYGVLP